MISIECISISVYDTQSPQVNDEYIQDYAEKGSVKIIYDGDDTKFQTLFASRCEFSLEVGHLFPNTDLFYEYLASGDETRYKVIVRDQDENTLWEGFILPDEYSEPYTTGTFWVNFTSTDGLGRLKGATLDSTFYTAKHSISKTICDCLKNTGLELELWVSPSFKNTGAGLRWDQLFVDGSAYINESSKTNCYDILDGILLEMGCTLWQQENKWYIIGINKRGLESPVYQHYDKDGVFIEEIQPSTYGATTIGWDATPDVSVLPAFKQVTVTVGVDTINPIFPEDIVIQSWTKTGTTTQYKDPLVKYWKGTGLTPELTYRAGLPEPTYQGTDITINSWVSAFNLYQNPTNQQILDNYISLATPPYLKGGEGQKITFNMKLSAVLANPFGNNATDDNMVYTVYLNNTIIFSNRQGFINRDAYRLEFTSQGYTASSEVITGELLVEDFILPESGYLDIRIHHINFGYVQQAIAISHLSLVYDAAIENVFVKRREIVSTKTQEITTFHGDSSLDNIDHAIIYQPFMSSGEFTQILFSAFFLYDSSGDPVGWALGVTLSNYSSLQSNSDRIYVKRENSDFYEYITDIVFYTDSGNYYVLIRFHDGYQVKVTDQLLIRTATGGNPQTTAIRNNREQWQKATNNTGIQRMGEILAETYHDVYYRQQIFFEGDVKGLVFPLNPLAFYFAGALRKWFPVRIEMEPGENTSRISIMQYSDQKVTDYE